MSQALRKPPHWFQHRKYLSGFSINQIREKMGVMFGNPETTTGGPRHCKVPYASAFVAALACVWPPSRMVMKLPEAATK